MHTMDTFIKSEELHYPWETMVIGKALRIQPRVKELVKKAECWDPEEDFGDAVENMANFCIEKKGEFKRWLMNKNKKK